MQRNHIVSYFWKRDSKRGTVKPEHEFALEDCALDRICSMLQKGYTSGELSEEIRADRKDKFVNYRGWWECTTPTHHGIISRSIGPFYYGGWDKKTDAPVWVKDPARAEQIPVVDLGALVDKVSLHSRGSVQGNVYPSEL